MSTLADFNDFIAAVRKDTGIASFVPDESGLVSVRVDDTYNVNLQFVEATGKVLCFIEITTLQKDAPAAGRSPARKDKGGTAAQAAYTPPSAAARANRPRRIGSRAREAAARSSR